MQISNINSIVKGWTSVLKGKTTEEHKRRADICNTCENAVYKKYLDFIDDDLKEVKGFVCEACGGCPLIAKIRSNDNCPVDKW